jgi:zinc protease
MMVLAALLCLAAGGTPGTTLQAIASDSAAMSYDVAGLHVIQRVNRASDIVAVFLYLLGGARQVTERTTGIEALVLRASANGTEHFPGGQARQVMARTGSDEVLEAGVDWTVFGFVGLRQPLDTAWAVFADRLMHPTLDREGVRIARTAMLAAVRRRYSNPDERIRLIANIGAFAGHPYALDPEGTDESLGQLGVEDLAAYARTQIVTARMLLVVVGNVERAHVESLVTATIGRLPRGEYRWSLPPTVPRKPSHWLIESRALPTNYILGYFVGPSASSDDYEAFHIATDLLSSRLFEEIRVERGLSYATYAPFQDWAVAVGGLYASTPQPERVLPLMNHQIESLLAARVDGFGLSRYVDTYLLDYLEKSSSSAAQADFLARAQLYLGDYRLTDRYMRQLRRVRPDDIWNAVDRYMQNVQWAYLGDTVRMSGKW